MSYPTIRSLIANGSLVLLHDYRAGHSASFVRDLANVYGDGATTGNLGRFRTGYGFETHHDSAATPLSQCYIRVADSASWFPPDDGCCIIASYVQSSDDANCQIIGQGDTVVANTSWMLRRRAAEILFTTSDGVALSGLSHAVAAVPGQIETVAVRYQGGTGANNCNVAIFAPVVSNTLGQIDRVPQNVAQPIGIASYSTSAQGPFHGTLRYVAFVRGKQTNAILASLWAEIEALRWNTSLSTTSDSYLTAARQLQYVSRFGVDRLVPPGITPLNNERIYNTHWHNYIGAGGVTGQYSVYFQHFGTNPNSFNDVIKALICDVMGSEDDDTALYLPITYGHATQAEAAYGTWDFRYLFQDPEVPGFVPMQFWPVTSTFDFAGNGYRLRTQDDGSLQLHRMPGATLIGASAAGVIPAGGGWRRVRITRSAAGVWNVYLNTGTAAGWTRVIGPATDNTHTVSAVFGLLFISQEERLDLGNAYGDGAFYKWAGVADPR